MKKKTTSYISMILVFVLIITLIISVAFSIGSRADASLESIKQEKKEAHQQVLALRKEKKKLASEKQILDDNLNDAQNKVDNIKSHINHSNKIIDAKNLELQSNLEILSEIKAKYKNKIVDIYENRTYLFNSELWSAISCTDITDFINKFDLISEILEKDKKTRSEIENVCKKVQLSKEQLQSEKSKLENLKTQLDSEVANLNVQSEAKQKQITEVQVDEKKYLEIERQRASEEAKMLRAIQRAKSRRTSSRGTLPYAINSTGLMWPVPSCRSVSSSFGVRIHPIFKTKRFHSGIDIPALRGSSIVAADNGIVIKSGYYGGYGNCVVILHDNGTSTLYGHGSHISVLKGQMVNKGQVIMAVGSTGFSTGPHLHFEVIVNDVRVNPLNYI